ncbi:hypothetical protein D3C85_1240480 [compost metagenome]
MNLQGKSFKVQNDLRHIFHYARNGRELMQNAVNLDRSHSGSRQGGQQNPAKRVPQSRAISTFQRFNYEFPIGSFIIGFYGLNLRLFDFYHECTPPSNVAPI